MILYLDSNNDCENLFMPTARYNPMSEKVEGKISRRRFITASIGAGVVGIIVGAAGAWLLKPEVVAEKTVTTTLTREVTKTVTATAPITVTPPPVGLDVVAQRAIDGVKSLIAKGAAKPGDTIRILHVAGSRANLEKAIELWSKYIPEIKIELITLGQEPDVYTKAMSEAVTKAGTFDAVTIFSTWLGDIVEAGLARPIDDFFSKYDPGYTGDIAPIEPLASYTTLYKGRRYALVFDSDVFTLSYRRDLLTDPKLKDQFRSQYGMELKLPDTWEELIKMAEFFTKLNLTAPSGGRVWGAYFYAEPRFAAYITWLNIFIESGGILFDLKTMDPKIDTKEGKYAFDVMLRLKPYMPPEAITASWADLYDKFVKGETVFTAAWPSLSKEAHRPTALVKDVAGSAVLPGVEVDVAGAKKIVRAAPNPVNWVAVISNYAKNPELTYLFFQFATSPDIGKDVILTGVILDLFRRCWFTDPKYRPAFEEGYGSEFVDAYLRSLEISFPDLLIRGGPEYLGKLTVNVNAVMAGTKDPEDALSETAADWDSINKKYGVDAQLEAWRALANLFPSDVKEVWRAKGYM
jgi:ABC-type glycerol-3-phosphate transport system substrate-binding protein